MQRVLITGANGWVGTALARALCARGDEVVGVSRRPWNSPACVAPWISPEENLGGLAALWPEDVRFDTVFHLAARVHDLAGGDSDLYAAYRQTNATATLEIASLAQRRGVKRFVFLSSSKAIGDSDPGRPLSEEDAAHPIGAYGQSKLEAERGLLQLRGLESVSIRSPLVYGPGVRANFMRLMSAVRENRLLPLGCANAPRSIIALENLIDALVAVANAPAPLGGVFHVSDEVVPTVRELVVNLGRLMGQRARLLPVPVVLLKLAGAALGRSAEIDRLVLPLRLNTSLITRTLGWRPPVAQNDALRHTIDAFMAGV